MILTSTYRYKDRMEKKIFFVYIFFLFIPPMIHVLNIPAGTFIVCLHYDYLRFSKFEYKVWLNLSVYLIKYSSFDITHSRVSNSRCLIFIVIKLIVTWSLAISVNTLSKLKILTFFNTFENQIFLLFFFKNFPSEYLPVCIYGRVYTVLNRQIAISLNHFSVTMSFSAYLIAN